MAALGASLLAAVAMGGLLFLVPSVASPVQAEGPAPPFLGELRPDRGLLVLGGRLPSALEGELRGLHPRLQVLTEADLPPEAQAALRLALEVSEAQGTGPDSEEVRRALREHAPVPVDLLVMEPSAADPAVLVPRLIPGP